MFDIITITVIKQELDAAQSQLERSRRQAREEPREFTKGGLFKGGLAIYAFHLCDCDALGSGFNAQIEHVPNC